MDAIILATPHSLYAEQIKRAVAAQKFAVRRLTPITGKDFINNITILEATIKSAASDGAVVKVLN